MVTNIVSSSPMQNLVLSTSSLSAGVVFPALYGFNTTVLRLTAGLKVNFFCERYLYGWLVVMEDADMQVSYFW